MRDADVSISVTIAWVFSQDLVFFISTLIYYVVVLLMFQKLDMISIDLGFSCLLSSHIGFFIL